MAALLASKVDREDVVTELTLDPAMFDAIRQKDDSLLEGRIDRAILATTARVQRLVGAGNYGSADQVTDANIMRGELVLVCSRMVRQVIMVIAANAQTVTEETADLGSLETLVAMYEDEADEALNPYVTSTTEVPTLQFSFSGQGIDEKLRDDYSARDFGNLP